MMEEAEFLIMFRRPEYPVLIAYAGTTSSAFKLKQLAEICVAIPPDENNNKVQVIDSTGSEFWYMPDKYVLTPGFVGRKWSKKKLIETFNDSSNFREPQQEYSMKSMSSKKLEKIIADLCEILNTEKK